MLLHCPAAELWLTPPPALLEELVLLDSVEDDEELLSVDDGLCEDELELSVDDGLWVVLLVGWATGGALSWHAVSPSVHAATTATASER
ncbi:hypothetical protein GCM10027599_17020 [Yimella radicis]